MIAHADTLSFVLTMGSPSPLKKVNTPSTSDQLITVSTRHRDSSPDMVEFAVVIHVLCPV